MFADRRLRPLALEILLSATHFTSPQKWMDLVKLGKTTLSTLNVRLRVRRVCFRGPGTGPELFVERFRDVGGTMPEMSPPKVAISLIADERITEYFWSVGRKNSLDPRVQGPVHQGQLELVVEVRSARTRAR